MGSSAPSKQMGSWHVAAERAVRAEGIVGYGSATRVVKPYRPLASALDTRGKHVVCGLQSASCSRLLMSRQRCVRLASPPLALQPGAAVSAYAAFTSAGSAPCVGQATLRLTQGVQLTVSQMPRQDVQM